MGPLRSSRNRHAQEATSGRVRGAIDHDPTEGLPVRRWELTDISISQEPKDEDKDANNAASRNGATELWPFTDLPLPRDFHLLPPHAQEFLRRAREPNKKPNIAIFNSETGEYERVGLDAVNPNGAQRPGQHKHTASSNSLLLSPAQSAGSSDDEDSHPAPPSKRAISLKRWTPLPQALADKKPEPKYLADRRPGLPPLYGHLAPAQHAGAIDANGTASAVAGGSSAEMAVAGIDMPMPMPIDAGLGATGGASLGGVVETPKRRPPPPPPKRKKKGGPGRSRKKVEIDVPEAAGGVQVKAEGEGGQVPGSGHATSGANNTALIDATMGGQVAAPDRASALPYNSADAAGQSQATQSVAPRNSGSIDSAMPDADLTQANEGSSESGSEEDDDDDEREGSEDGEIDESVPHAPAVPTATPPATAMAPDILSVPTLAPAGDVSALAALPTAEGVALSLDPPAALETVESNEPVIAHDPQEPTVPGIPSNLESLPITSTAPLFPLTVTDPAVSIPALLSDPTTSAPVIASDATVTEAVEATTLPSPPVVAVPILQPSPDHGVQEHTGGDEAVANDQRDENLPVSKENADVDSGQASPPIEPTTAPPAPIVEPVDLGIPGLVEIAGGVSAAVPAFSDTSTLDAPVSAPAIGAKEDGQIEGKVGEQIEVKEVDAEADASARQSGGLEEAT